MMTKTKLAFIAAAAVTFAPACADDSGNDTGTGSTGDSAGTTSAGGSTSSGSTSTGTTTQNATSTTGGADTTGGATDTGGTTGGDPTPRGPDNPPVLGAQLDRSGRPAISTALISTFNPDAAAKAAARDGYNKTAMDSWAAFTPNIEENLAILDGLDGVCGNQLYADGDPNNRYNALATILTDDQIYIKANTGECGVYLGLEAEIVGAIPVLDGKCGGRMPPEDIIDRSYSVLAAGILTGIDDTITADDGAQTTTFPYLGAPSRTAR